MEFDTSICNENEGDAMIVGRTPMGLDCTVEEIENSITETFSLGDPAAATQFYLENGYVILKSAIPTSDVDQVNFAFEQTIKPTTKKLYRQQDGRLDVNRFNHANAMINPILNPQSVDAFSFKNYREAIDIIYSNQDINRLLKNLMGDEPGLVQGMHFDANSATWDHQDSYYLDGEELGTMIAAWFALESIDPNAGRFFVVPRSHRWVIEQSDEINMVTKHEEYKSIIKERVLGEGLNVIAPVMEKGDVLLWHPFTVHGSLAFPSDPLLTRKSLTAHFIPSSRKFRIWHSLSREMSFESVQGSNIARPKDLKKLKNKLAYSMEDCLPHTFNTIKKVIKRKFIK